VYEWPFPCEITTSGSGPIEAMSLGYQTRCSWKLALMAASLVSQAATVVTASGPAAEAFATRKNPGPSSPSMRSPVVSVPVPSTSITRS
jgi:hypothetical protein